MAKGLTPERQEIVTRELAGIAPTQDFADLGKRLVAIDSAIGLGADAQVVIEDALVAAGADPRSTVKWMWLLEAAAQRQWEAALPLLLAGLLRPWIADGTSYGPYDSHAIWLKDLAKLFAGRDLTSWRDAIRAHFKGNRNARVRAIISALLGEPPPTRTPAEAPLKSSWAIDSYGAAATEACLAAVLEPPKPRKETPSVLPQGAARLVLEIEFETQRIRHVALEDAAGNRSAFPVGGLKAGFPMRDGARPSDALARELRRRLHLEEAELAWGDTGLLPTVAVLHEHYRVAQALSQALVERGVLRAGHQLAVGDAEDDRVDAKTIDDEVRALSLSEPSLRLLAAALYASPSRREELVALVLGPGPRSADTK